MEIQFVSEMQEVLSKCLEKVSVQIIDARTLSEAVVLKVAAALKRSFVNWGNNLIVHAGKAEAKSKKSKLLSMRIACMKLNKAA